MSSSLVTFTKGQRILTAGEMRRIDRLAIKKVGVPGVLLMENAGRALADAVSFLKWRRVAVFCGTGNNGGDGLALARTLANRGQRVKIVLAKSPRHFSDDALAHWRLLGRLKIPTHCFQTEKSL